MKNSQKFVIYLLLIGIGGVIGFGVNELKNYVFTPSDAGANFVKACADLNGQNLTLENIKKLNGKIYVSYLDKNGTRNVGLESVRENYIDQYFKNIETKEMIYEKNPHIAIHNGSFDVSRENLDNDWRCNIKADQQTHVIRTTSYFQPD